MGIKKIQYYNQNISTQETIRILDCGYHETENGHSSAQKMVDHYILHCIIRGKGQYHIGGKTFELSRGDCFLLPPHRPILYQSDAADPWVYYWIGFDGTNLQHLFTLWGMSTESPILHDSRIDDIETLFRPIVASNITSVSETYRAISVFYALCSILINNNQKNKPMSVKETYVTQVTGLILNSYFKNINIQTLSDAVGLDRTYLHRIFKEVHGVSIKKYIGQLRINRAKEFLANTEMSMEQIAYYCGYSTEQYFSIAFKKETGMAPSVYRKATARKSCSSSIQHLETKPR
ncbi:MAG: AraC family transcriptional regulator [Lachnospiraceae bacterium]|jgi:AraC-like DNA-binding protein|nr:AraC family transcriptional regulator [Lachnospiraceae bacterium]MCH4031951.1 AraC family transcriptional regulator [Lachnospiraceae bacterium]MCH4070574.1 AraC family transcriptional regulator [Lachnospiraceae bacterium]MCH4109242.1 AraC family transcriptional regulator [Lachnospiraceae bacterium]MCI1303197.1 AraC family transcriptional regulator [Lachnospiraceae bacterium]